MYLVACFPASISMRGTHPCRKERVKDGAPDSVEPEGGPPDQLEMWAAHPRLHHFKENALDILFHRVVTRCRKLTSSSFPLNPRTTKPGESYEKAKPLHRARRIVRRDRRVVSTGAKRREFACFIRSFACFGRSLGRQSQCHPLRARISLSVQLPGMFLCETLTVRTAIKMAERNHSPVKRG
jgi:hypothetical protein